MVTTLPEMLSEFAGSRMVWPVDVVTTTILIEPSLPVTTWLTVPTLAPVLDCTLRPVVSPGSVSAETEPPARTLFSFAFETPVGDALFGPWLFTRP